MNKRQREKRAKQDRRDKEYRVWAEKYPILAERGRGVRRALIAFGTACALLIKQFSVQTDKARIRREAKEVKQSEEMASYERARRTASQNGMPFIEDDPKRGLHPMFTDPPLGPTVPESPKDTF